jgi:hypothetical protein
MKAILYFILFFTIAACSDQSKKSHSLKFEDAEAGYRSADFSYSKLGYTELKTLLNSNSDRKKLLNDYEFYMRASGRDYTPDCESEVYNVVKGNSVLFDTPYIEICDCCNEGMLSITFSGSSKHKDQYDKIVDSALSDNYSDPYVIEYEDGTFIKEYDKKSYALTLSSHIIGDGSFAYEAMLMYWLPD